MIIHRPHQILAARTLSWLASLTLCAAASAQTSDAVLNALVRKGILTEKEAKEVWAESQSNLVNQAQAPVGESKWKINNAIKNINLFGDVRFRYEYREADNTPGSGVSGDDFRRERFRYAVRVGIRGDLFDDFYYGLRLDTSANARSPFVTFGDDSNPNPFAKTSDGLNIGQVYLGWHPTDWCEMMVGKMPMPLYTTPMVWSSYISPEGFVEKFKHTTGNVDLFANFGQFLYQDTTVDADIPSSDTFLLAWQVGANVNFSTSTSFKVAPVLYNYTGVGQNNGLNRPFSGQGLNGTNTTPAGFIFNQSGINDLLILETPVEFDFKIGRLNARAFADFAYNFEGADRARAAFATTPPAGGLTRAFTDENKAYQIGFGIGNGGPVYGPMSGLVYGTTSKKNTWEARVYWDHVEQYALDVNLLDVDFFEGLANLEGVYSAFAYSFTDNIIATFRYGYAQRINDQLGTGGNFADLATLNPVRNFHLVQVDLTMRF